MDHSSEESSPEGSPPTHSSSWQDIRTSSQDFGSSPSSPTAEFDNNNNEPPQRREDSCDSRFSIKSEDKKKLSNLSTQKANHPSNTFSSAASTRNPASPPVAPASLSSSYPPPALNNNSGNKNDNVKTGARPSAPLSSTYTTANNNINTQQLNRTLPSYPLSSSNIVQVPLINQTVRRNRFIEVPEVHVIEKIHPKIQIQEIIHKVPRVDIQWVEKLVEVPEVRIIDKNVEVPDIREKIRYVKKTEYKEVIKEIPRYETQYVEKYVEVPEVKQVIKYVEVPEIREVKKYVEKVKIVEVPVEKIKHVRKIEVRKIEKIRHIEGPIEYIDMPVERIIEKPVYQTIEKIVEVPEIQEVIVETPLMVPSERSPVVDIPIEVPVYYDVPQYKKVPGKVIPIEKEKIYEKIVEIPVPVPQETLRVIKVPREKKVEIIKEVEVPHYIDEVIQVPKYVPVLAPPPIIMPVAQDEIIEGVPIYESASPRYIYEPPVYAPPVFEKISPQKVCQAAPSPPAANNLCQSNCCPINN